MATLSLRSFTVFLVVAVAQGLWATAPGRLGREPDTLESQALRPRAIAIPSQKLALCFFKKSGSTAFGQLFNSVNGFVGVHSAVPSHLGFLGMNWSQASHEAGWKFVVFVRDPLERYLSAFLSNCVPKDGYITGPPDEGKSCFGPTLSGDVSKEEKIAFFEKRVQRDYANGLPDDDQWQTQYRSLTKNCGLDKFEPQQLDFIGVMSGDMDLTHSRVKSMLEATTSLPNVPELVQQYFPVPQKPVSLLQCDDGHCTSAHDWLTDFYRKPEIVKAVFDLVHEDYQRFALGVPDFARWFQ